MPVVKQQRVYSLRNVPTDMIGAVERRLKRECMRENQKDITSWFKENMDAVACDNVFGECGKCALRNLSLFCNRLECRYYDEVSDCFQTVYWFPKNHGFEAGMLQMAPPRECVRWFNETPLNEIRRVSLQMVQEAHQHNK